MVIKTPDAFDPVQNLLDLLKCSLRPYRALEFFRDLERLLTVCLFRCDPPLPALFITAIPDVSKRRPSNNNTQSWHANWGRMKGFFARSAMEMGTLHQLL